MRIRTIKPEFFFHEGLFEAEKSTGFPLRVAFAGLWCASDREGRFKWEPRRLGASILPYDDVDFSRVLHALTTRGFVVKYRVGEAWFGAIPSWKKHQFVNARETKSDIPDVSKSEELDASCTRESRDDHACNKEGKGKEGKGNINAPADADASFGPEIVAENDPEKELPLNDDPFPPALQTDAFKDAWNDWLAYRRARKLSTYKPQSIRAQLCTLAEWGHDAAIASIRESIRQQWQGLFPPKGGNHNSGPLMR